MALMYSKRITIVNGLRQHPYSLRKQAMYASLRPFKKLNAVIKRKPFPLPKTSDVVQKLSGCKNAMAINLSMGYYIFLWELKIIQTFSNPE